MSRTLFKFYTVGILDDTVCDLFGISHDFVSSYADAMTFRTNERMMTARSVRLAFISFLLECETCRDLDGNYFYRNDNSEAIKTLSRVAPRCPPSSYICDRLSKVVG